LFSVDQGWSCCDRENAEAHTGNNPEEFKVVLAIVPYRTGEKHKTALFSDALGLRQTLPEVSPYVNNIHCCTAQAQLASGVFKEPLPRSAGKPAPAPTEHAARF